MMIINRNKAFWSPYTRSPFRPTDCKKALEYIKATDKELGVNTLERKTLEALEFTFHESGILVSGNYIGEPFPAFANKPKSQGVIIIVNRNITIANLITYLNDINKDLNPLINANNISLANNPKVKLSGLALS